ncbi:GNAT family N-acetyltransferase [Cognatishimia sp. F0-27]|uniref:GNAT family N-acetyltransferase n=1 Tax=Cognatishimia sp. F0-27 TaxID=2816855 RepID=UPI001D0C2C4C|nr:GNAT family protein [Cognatishimia sp. F0-27]MCC1491964.1 GNAT family N-acetyltransferase [Cognatishimia sp. F0-27]
MTGAPVTGAFPRPYPPHVPLSGRSVRLDPLRLDDADALFEAFAEDPSGSGWTYMPLEPWDTPEVARRFCATQQASADPQFYCIRDRDDRASGFCSYLRINPAVGTIEVGWIHFAPRMRRSVAATEAIYLLMRNAFETLGYRRFEWKCDALNAASRAAAERFGFTYEGTHRQASITKGRNRDTAWFSILDHEWPAQKSRFERWLSPGNFDSAGRQRTRLSAC